MRTQSGVLVRRIAVAAAAVTSLLYLLIGFEVLPIGQAAGGADANLMEFGVWTCGTFAVIAVLLAGSTGRLLWSTVAVATAIVLVGYFVMAGLREPPFAFWGLVVKGVQTVLLVAVGYLAVRSPAQVSSRTPA
jgi:hypothetical protein